MKANAIYGQSGGPTSVINASFYGVIKECQVQNDKIENIFFMKNGIMGLINDDIKNVNEIPQEEIELLPSTPSAICGSVRYKMKPHTENDEDYQKILSNLKKHNIRYIFLNGGNDSMDTCAKLAAFLKSSNYECYIVGIPKTIDNDLINMDHTPGFSSAAKFIVTVMKSIHCDNECYKKGRVNIVEIMGRDAGWLTASSSLANLNGEGPDLIYIPEIAFDEEKFLNDVKNIYSQKKRCLVAVSEGIRTSNGEFIFTQGVKDAFAHAQLGGVGLYLANLVNEKLNISTRAIELSLLQRCFAPLNSLTDVNEAIECGRKAVEFALNHQSEIVVAMQRENDDQYLIKYEAKSVYEIANAIKYIPRDYMNEEGNHVSKKFIDYCLPLINGENKNTFEKGVIRFANKNYFE